jgi:hypothetical protein
MSVTTKKYGVLIYFCPKLMIFGKTDKKYGVLVSFCFKLAIFCKTVG